MTDYKSLYEDLVPKYQNLVKWYDKQNGTPCEQIRSQQIIDDLVTALGNAIEWLERFTPIHESHSLKQTLAKAKS